MQRTCCEQIYILELKETCVLAMQTITPLSEFLSSKFYVTDFLNVKHNNIDRDAIYTNDTLMFTLISHNSIQMSRVSKRDFLSALKYQDFVIHGVLPFKEKVTM